VYEGKVALKDADTSGENFSQLMKWAD